VDIQKIIKFYRDCYQYEYNTERVANFYAKGISHLYYPESFKIVSQDDYELPVSSTWGQDVYSELELSSSEKKLICGTFFVKGKAVILGKTQKIFTPIYLHDVMLNKTDDVFFIHVDADSVVVNPIAINYLNSIEATSAHKYDDLAEALLGSNQPFSFDGLVKLTKFLKDKYPEVNTSLIERRIQSEDRLSDLEKVYSSRKSGYENLVFPDLLIGLVDKPKKSKGVINELTELSTRNISKNSTLSQVFGKASNGRVKNTKKNTVGPVVPVSLSNRQEKILDSARKSKITIVVGPPGTGKSFSIAALAVQAAHEGKKVLIASKSEQACQVINNKIKKDIGINGITLDASKPRFRISVAAKLRNIANGIGVRELTFDAFKRLKNEVIILKSSINRAIDEISDRGLVEVRWGKKLADNRNGLIAGLQREWIKYRHNSKKPIWKTKYLLHKTEEQLRKKERKFIRAVYQNRLFKLLGNHRQEFLKLEEAFLEEKGNLIKEIFSSVDYEIILKALPIWICKSSDIANILPLDEELFDLTMFNFGDQTRSSGFTVVWS